MEETKLRIAALQGVLQAGKSYNTRVDGVVGPATKKAIVTNLELAQRAADAIGGEELQALIANATAGQRDAIEAIRSAAAELGADANQYIAKAQIESGLSAVAQRGNYRGLFQMGRDAWADSASFLADAGHKALPAYDNGWDNAFQNARAAMAYEMVLEDQVRKLGWSGQLSDSDRYIAHQQGAAGLVRLKKAADGKALDPAAEAAMLRAMRSNPPQDGQGVTVDPAQFLSRWDSVYATRLADAIEVASRDSGRSSATS